MLGKCTNPSCSASFRYLQEGILFRLEVDPALRLPNPKQPEYYWLCHSCSSAMTLRLSRDGKVIPVPLSTRVDSSRDSRRQGGRPGGRQGPNFIPSKPQNGLLLTGVHFAAERHHRSKGAAAGEEDTMSDDWDDHADVVAAGSSCPASECGASALAYGPPDRGGRDHAEPRESTSPRREINLAVPECAVPRKDELIFQGVLRNWLVPRVQAA